MSEHPTQIGPIPVSFTLGKWRRRYYCLRYPRRWWIQRGKNVYLFRVPR